jgi:hypothetical protein
LKLSKNFSLLQIDHSLNHPKENITQNCPSNLTQNGERLMGENLSKTSIKVLDPFSPFPAHLDSSQKQDNTSITSLFPKVFPFRSTLIIIFFLKKKGSREPFSSAN